MNRQHIVVVLLLAGLSRPVSAEPPAGAVVSGVVGGAAIEARTEVTIAGAIGYRVNRFLGFGVELTSIPTLKSDATTLRSSTIVDSLGAGAALGAPGAPGAPTISPSDGHATIFTTNVRVEVPAIAARVVPYGIAGGGVANVKDRFTVSAPVAAAGIPLVVPPQTVTQSSTDFAITAGGGVSVLVAAHVSVEADLRYLRFVATRDVSVGRFGIGLSYRF